MYLSLPCLSLFVYVNVCMHIGAYVSAGAHGDLRGELALLELYLQTSGSHSDDLVLRDVLHVL